MIGIKRAEPVVRANADIWHVGCGAAFGASCRRGSPVTLGASRMIFEVFMRAASPVGVLEAERVACSSGYKLSVASSRRGVFSRVQKNKKEDGVGGRELKVVPPVTREVLFALVDTGRLRMSFTPHFPNQSSEPTTTSVTICAEPQIAPAAVAAHL